MLRGHEGVCYHAVTRFPFQPPDDMNVTYDPKAARTRKLAALWALLRERAREGHHSVVRQLVEMAALWALNGLKPPYYFTAGLYRKELAWPEKRAHVSHKTYRRYLTRINPAAYQIVTNNKVVTHGLLSSFGIPTPAFYGMLNPGSGRSFDNHPLRTHADLAQLLSRIPVTHIVCKPVSGYRGAGFFKAKVERDTQTLTLIPDERRVTTVEFWNDCLRMNPSVFYLCQAAIDQHPDVARFNPSSLNTIRAWMCRREDESWEMYAAVLRMGVGEVATDNLSRGGLGPRVDLDTGRLRAAIDRRVERPTYTVHPATGVQIEGATVPLWSDVIALCQSTCELFPFLRLMAVDVAIGPDAPVVTEVESVPDEHQVGFDLGVGPLFSRLAAGRA